VLPQVIYNDTPELNCDAIAIGMGGGTSRELFDKICYLLKNYSGKLLIDADGLNSLAEYGVNVLDDKRCQVLITPHIKEFSRLSGLDTKEILSNFVGCAQEFALKHNITVLLKSAATVISDGKKTFINAKGSSALAKAGSGDMLAGIICGSMARGLNILDGAVCGAWLLGECAESCSKKLTDYCTTAQDVLKELPDVVKRLTR
jgi:NAD(P)H-hydrate epimerase